MPLVRADAVLLGQVFANLLENALKPHARRLAAHDRGARHQRATRAVEVDVADRGPGLAPGDEERVFEKFYRAKSAKSRGVGLGLAICRGVVVAHGGDIRAIAREGGGTIFRFTLPVAGAPLTEADVDEEERAASARPIEERA